MKEQTQSLLKKYESFILPIVSLVLAIALLALVVIPQALKIPETNSKIDVAKQLLQKLHNKLSLLEQVDSDQYKKDTSIALVALPADRDVSGVFSQTLQLLVDNGMKITDIGVSTPVVGISNPNVYTVNIEVDGPTIGLSNFIKSTSNMTRIAKVLDLDVTVNRANPEQLQARVSLMTFFQVLPSTIGNIEQGVNLIIPTEKELLAEIERKVAATNAQSPPVGEVGKPDPFQ